MSQMPAPERCEQCGCHLSEEDIMDGEVICEECYCDYEVSSWESDD